MTSLCTVEIHEYCSSTMDLAQDWVRHKMDHGNPTPHFIQCYTQQNGRGKAERVWVSEKGDFLGTLIMPFPFEVRKGGEISFLVAVALGAVLNEISPELKLQFKWPNDFILADKKLGGVLLERIEESNKNVFLSIGVGVNFVSLPADLPATCLKTYIHLPSLDHFRDLFLEKMFYYYDLWIKKGFSEIRALWLQGAWNLGKPIQFAFGKEIVKGIFKTINHEGALVLICKGGLERSFYTGDVFFAPSEKE